LEQLYAFYLKSVVYEYGRTLTLPLLIIDVTRLIFLINNLPSKMMEMKTIENFVLQTIEKG